MKLQVNLSRVSQLKKTGKLISILLLFLLSSSLSIAQLTYPVSVNTSVPGPSPMLLDYQVSSRIVFNVTLNDMQVGSRQVKFKIKIESQGGGMAYSAISKTNVFSGPNGITLYSGQPTVVRGEDIDELFDPSNLVITSSYIHKDAGIMPEGLYTIKLIAYDYLLGYPLSNAEVGYATLFITHLQPPILTLPLTQKNIDLADLVNNSTYFSWIPRNNGAPIGKEIKYKLYIYPILSNQTAGTAINNTPLTIPTPETVNPFYTLQNSDFISATASYPVPSDVKEFAWRVQAYFTDNAYNPIFINQGFSEIFTFTTYTPCAAPVLAPATLNNTVPLQLTASWTVPGQTEFARTELHYREKTRWTTWNLIELAKPANSKILNDLKADTYYEAMVRSVCTTGTKTYYSDWKSFIDTRTDAGITSTIACIAPYNVLLTNSGNTITLNWTEGNPDRVSKVYTVQYKLKSETNWTTAINNRTVTNYTLPALTNNNSYDIRVGSNCGDGSVSYGDIYSVSLPITGALSSCNYSLPFEVKAEVIAEKEQTKISWPGDNNDRVYKFYYRKRFEAGASWKSIITGVSYVIIDSLDYGESYECKIEKDCGGGVLVTSPTRYFQLDDPYLTSGNGINNSGDCFPPDYATAEVKGTATAPKIEFSWKAVAGAQSYKLEYENLDVPNSKVSVPVQSPATSYLLSLLAINVGNTFKYTVQARCDNKWSITTQANTIKVVIDPNKVSSCDTVTIVAAQTGDTTLNTFTLRWLRKASATGYVIEYRPLTATTPEWYSMPMIVQPAAEVPANPNQQVTGMVDKLDQDAVYQYRIKTICGTTYSEYTSLRKIRTLKNKDLNCGADQSTNPTNTTPGTIAVNDNIKASDFTLKVKTVTGTGPYSGTAAIDIELWGKLTFTAEFTNAQFNTDKELIAGKIVLKGAQLQYLPDEVRNTINSAITTIGDSFDKLQEVLDLIYDLGGIERKDPVGQSAYNPALVTSAGESAGTIKVDKSTGVITNNAAQFGVNSGTTVAVINKSAADSIKKTLSSGILDDGTGKTVVSFTISTDQKYGYDKYLTSTGRLESIYEKSGSTYIDWKSVGAGMIDRINVNITGSTAEERAKIKIISLAGIEYKIQEKDGQKFILVTGSIEGTVQEIYGWYSNGTNGTKLAKINVAAYKPKKNILYLVPVNGASVPAGITSTSIRDTINEVFKGSIIEWDVTIAGNYNAGMNWDKGEYVEDEQLVGDKKVKVDDTDLLESYSDEMNNVIKVFTKTSAYIQDDNTYYLFYGFESSDSDVKGYMPRSKNIGFIFDNTSGIRKTIAHEFGHGLTLKHIWKEDITLTEGATANLMDYGTPQGTELWKNQWELLKYPKIVIPFVDKEEDAMAKPAIALSDANIADFLEQIHDFRLDGIYMELKVVDVKVEKVYQNAAVVLKDNNTYKIKLKTFATDKSYSFNTNLFENYFKAYSLSANEYGIIYYYPGTKEPLITIIAGSKEEAEKLKTYLYGNGEHDEILELIHKGSISKKNFILTYSKNHRSVSTFKKTIDDTEIPEIFCMFGSKMKEGTYRVIDLKKAKRISSGVQLYNNNELVYSADVVRGTATEAEYKDRVRKLQTYLLGEDDGILVMNIYADGRIVQHVPRAIQADFGSPTTPVGRQFTDATFNQRTFQVRYIYFDRNNEQTDYGIYTYIMTTNLYVADVFYGTTALVDLIDVRQLRQIGFTMALPELEHARYYLNLKTFASLIGALREVGYTDQTFNGFSDDQGQPDPSSSHKNGFNGDFRLLRNDQSGGACYLWGTSWQQMDETRENLFSDALFNFGWGQMLSQKYNGNTLIRHAIHDKNKKHYDHLHAQIYNLGENFRRTYEP